MWINNFAESLAQGPFLVFALIIGFMVSIDVFVVEFSRRYEPENVGGKLKNWTSRMWTMAIWHSLFHSISFYIYIMIIFAAQKVAFFPIEFFDLPDGVGLGLLTFINFLIVSFVWWTYRSKIKEDHSKKSDDSDAVERRDMKFLVDLVRALSHRFNFGEKARGVAIAGSVAVDMLAISALLKIYLIPNESGDAISSLFGSVYIDVAIFALIIAIVVFGMVLAAQGIGAFFRESIKLIVFLRLLEPFAVFFIMAGALRAILQFEQGAYVDKLNGYGLIYDVIFAIVIVISLLISSGVSWKELVSTYKGVSSDRDTVNPIVTFSDVFDDVKGLKSIAWIAISLLAVITASMGFAYSTEPGRATHNHLIEATGYIAELALVLAIGFLYAPWKKIDLIETGLDVNIRQVHSITPREYWSTWTGVFLALISFNLFNVFIFGFAFEVNAMIMWSFYVLFSWLLFDLRRWRFFVAGGRVLGTGRTNDAAYAELIAAIGLASSVVAVVSSRVVAQLIS